MLPRLPVKYLPHVGLTYIELPRNSGLVAFCSANGPYVILRELRQTIALSASLSAVGGAVSAILFGRFPRQIANRVFEAVAVYVSPFMPHGLRPHERHEHNYMDAHTSAFPVIMYKADVDVVSPGASETAFDKSARLAALSANDPLYPAQGANGILGGKRYRLPNLIGIIGISHSAVPSRGGQGRAMFPASFRPANDSAFLPERQSA